MQSALNAVINKLASEGESLKLSYIKDIAALREENRFLQKELYRVLGKVKDIEEQMPLVCMVILQCIFRIEFMDQVKAISMLFTNSMCITEGGGTCAVPLLWGKPLPINTLTTMHLEMEEFSSATFIAIHQVKGVGALKKDLEECKKGGALKLLKLLKGHPLRKKVDCVRESTVVGSRRSVASPR
ncbi:hypothetical protein GH714_035387 [Hevea brasiliensis]|uniref:Uncharacterized protein n=1 Tax=Hevea brasiliensis TaxID=3981 RepID=A0A6A6KYH9_HEVBR|nr:hypothetical protein GH714_035387 [Hevea brasiliensis]